MKTRAGDEHIAAIYMTLGQLMDLGNSAASVPDNSWASANRLGAPGLRSTAASLNTSAGSSTKIESGNCSSGSRTVTWTPAAPQGGDVRLVLGNDAFEYRRRTWVGAQAIDDASPGERTIAELKSKTRIPTRVPTGTDS